MKGNWHLYYMYILPDKKKKKKICLLTGPSDYMLLIPSDIPFELHLLEDI